MANFPDGTPNPIELPVLSNPSGFAPSEPKADPYIAESASIAPGASLELGEWQFSLPEGLKTFSFVVTLEAETAAHGVLPSVMNTGTGTEGSPNILVRGFAGKLGQGFADGPLSSASFGLYTLATAVAADGTIFVADTFNNAIRRIGTDGQVATIVGSPTSPGNIDGSSTVSQITLPSGIACSPDGLTIYFTQLNSVVRVATASAIGNPASRSTWTVTTAAGLAGTNGTADHTSGTNARFMGTEAIVYVSPTTYYVADANRIRVINRTGSGFTSDQHSVRTLAGGTAGGYADGTLTNARFTGVPSIALNPEGDVIASDGVNYRIRKITSGGTVTTLAGSGTFGYLDSETPLSARFASLGSIAVDRSGYAYVMDSGNKLIRRISPQGAVSTVAGTLGLPGGTDGPGNSALFRAAGAGMSILPGGDLLITDESRLRLVQRVISN